MFNIFQTDEGSRKITNMVHMVYGTLGAISLLAYGARRVIEARFA